MTKPQTDVASLELCKELCALSHGWGQDVATLWWVDGWGHPQVKPKSGGGIPAYTLGYLLDKLPDYVHVWKSATTQKPGTAEVYYPKDVREKIGTISHDTPTDAVCALAIELIKQGVLK